VGFDPAAGREDEKFVVAIVLLRAVSELSVRRQPAIQIVYFSMIDHF
jgi:hypothetical protein